MPRKLRFPPYPSRPHRGSGQARITITEATGRRDVWLGPHGSDESWDRYREELARWQTARAGGSVPPPAAGQVLTVEQLIYRWLVHAKAECSERGREYAQHKLAIAPLKRLFGSLPVGGFTAPRLEELRTAMVSGSWMTSEEQERYRKRGLPIGLCRTTANRRIVRIRTMWGWAESKGLAPPGSYHHLLSLKGIKRKAQGVRHPVKRRPATEADIHRVLPLIQPHWKRRPVAAMLQLQWLTGCRSQDVRIMRTADIDQVGVDAGGVRVWLYRPHLDKGDWRDGAEEAPRIIPLGPAAQQLLADWLLPDQPEAYLFRPRGRRDRGLPYAAGHYAQCVRRAARRAGLPWLQPYCARHGFRVRVSRELNLESARAAMGHASASMTAQYAHGQDVAIAANVARLMG